MAINFSKHLKSEKISYPSDPIEIYNSLDWSTLAGPLRPTQLNILQTWYSQKIREKDLIIKLPTGSGKTLIGLLILKSKLNSNEGPCIYICPNSYLVNQVKSEAEKFGIETCIFQENNKFPIEFTEGKAILITTAQKFFNGKTVFGMSARHTGIGSIVLDDSHSVIDVISNAFTISLSKDTQPYIELLKLFTPDLKKQGEGTFLDLTSNDYNTLMEIPYWSWSEKSSEVLEILREYKESNEIKYSWPLLKDIISKCKAFISGNRIEISPYYIPIEKFPAFQNAKNRILMSATTQNDTFFIQGLGFKKDTIINPLIDTSVSWLGEKMFIIPELINGDNIFIDEFRSHFSKIDYPFGTLAIVPSNKKALAYTNNGANLVNQNQLSEHVALLKKHNYADGRKKLTVISNKYDGIDLPDSACRILILDSLPYFENLSDSYEERVRPSSDIIQKKLAQKIEQGLGRSIRGEKDYSAVILLGYELIDFITNPNTKKLFSEDTQKQIKIGNSIIQMTAEETSFDSNLEIIKHLISVINQCLNRDEGWKEYYKEHMDSSKGNSEKDNQYFDILESEYKAEKLFYQGNIGPAITEVQKIIDQTQNNLEKGWYLQAKARYEAEQDKLQSLKTQKAAQKLNQNLLLPEINVEYNKLENIEGNRTQRIIDFLKSYKNYDHFRIDINKILKEASFGQRSDKFENAIDMIGKFLGYVTERPDTKIKKGPDNLWAVRNNEYFLFECKSEVLESRNSIHKDEAGQMNNHCGWFDTAYGVDTSVKRFIIVPTKNLAHEADFTHSVRVIRNNRLNQLKYKINKFVESLKEYSITELNSNIISTLLATHNLQTDDFEKMYSEEYKHL
ncbi:DEAD/DEAH box helicase [Lactococcus lactis]|uniref:DEAD/DEAH box helicase n=1 Tax=Lactococcus lactis TaxID=1358 RepID=UPI0022E2B400|nr:DEAD/DEAH box helicase [Lactococcus lactis]